MKKWYKKFTKRTATKAKGWRPRHSAAETSTSLTKYRPKSMGSPISERAYVKLQYVEVVTASYPAQTITGLFEWQTSMFDPRYNTGGHQPLWFDQFAGLYKSYRVFGIKYHITIIGNFDYGIIAWVKHSTDPNLESSLETLLERPDRTTATGYSYTGPVHLKGYMGVAETYGVKKSAVKNNAEFASLVSTSPSKMAYIIPGLYQFHPSASQSYTFQVHLTYYAEFFDRIDVGGS